MVVVREWCRRGGVVVVQYRVVVKKEREGKKVRGKKKRDRCSSSWYVGCTTLAQK